MTADCIRHAVLDTYIVKYIFRFRFRPKMAGIFRFRLFFGRKRKFIFRLFLFYGRKSKIHFRSASTFYVTYCRRFSVLSADFQHRTLVSLRQRQSGKLRLTRLDKFHSAFRLLRSIIIRLSLLSTQSSF